MATPDDEDESESVPRGRTIPVPPWWYERANAALERRKLTVEQLAVELGIKYLRVWRCLNRKTPTIDVVNAISAFLEIAPPVRIAETEAEAEALTSSSGPPTPSEHDETKTIVRKNLIRFRMEAGHDQATAADSADIDYAELRRIELGEVDPPIPVLERLAKAYGHKLGDLFQLQPPEADLGDVPWIHFRVRPPYKLTDEDVAELMVVVRRIEERFRALKRKEVEKFKAAKSRRARGTKAP